MQEISAETSWRGEELFAGEKNFPGKFSSFEIKPISGIVRDRKNLRRSADVSLPALS